MAILFRPYHDPQEVKPGGNKTQFEWSEVEGLLDCDVIEHFKLDEERELLWDERAKYFWIKGVNMSISRLIDRVVLGNVLMVFTKDKEIR